MSPLALLTVRNSVLAQLVKGALEAEGIETHLEREALGAVYGLDVGRWATRIFVREADLERARDLLAEIEADF